MTHVYWVYVRGVAFFSRRDMTHLFVRRGVYICVSWLIHMWDITHSCVRHDSFVCEAWLNYLWGWYIQLRELLDTYVRHDSFMCVRHGSFMCETWLIHVWDMTSCLTSCPRHVPAYRWVMSLHISYASRTRCETRPELTVSQSTKLQLWKNYDFRQSCDELRLSTKLWRKNNDKVVTYICTYVYTYIF